MVPLWVVKVRGSSPRRPVMVMWIGFTVVLLVRWPGGLAALVAARGLRGPSRRSVVRAAYRAGPQPGSPASQDVLPRHERKERRRSRLQDRREQQKISGWPDQRPG